MTLYVTIYSAVYLHYSSNKYYARLFAQILWQIWRRDVMRNYLMLDTSNVECMYINNYNNINKK